jgi:hypothetical protein
VVVECSVPAADFELGRVLQEAEYRQAELERVVAIGSRGETDRIAPFFWVMGADAAALEATLGDAAPFEEVRLLDTVGDRALFHAEWDPAGEDFLGGLADLDVAILEAVGDADRWEFRLRFHTDEALSAFQASQREQEFSIDVRRVAEFVNWEAQSSAEALELTSAQHDALRLAVEEGYFAVPRRTNLVDLGDRLEISSQSLSERLRRAERKVLGTTLLAEPETGPESDPGFQ